MARKRSSDEFRKMPEYEEGRRAYLDMKTQVDCDPCPYSKGRPRIAWLTGYYDQRTAERTGIDFRLTAASEVR